MSTLLGSVLSGLAAESGAAFVDFNFTGGSLPLYDLTGDYRLDQQVRPPEGPPLTLSLTLALVQDALGRLHGAGSNTVRLGGDSYAATYEVNGRVSGGGRRTRATLTVRAHGQGTVAGGNPALALTVRYDLEVGAAGLAGKAHGTVFSAGLGRLPVRSQISGIPLPAAVDGSWSVHLDPPAAGERSGSGWVTLPNGRNVRALLTGGSTGVTNVDRVKFSGTTVDRGNAMTIYYDAETLALRKLSGRLLGQAVAGVATPTQFAGAQACSECHGPTYQAVTNTFHAQVGVQCENCHGPAAEHAANSYDPLVRPKVDFSGAACGTCHSGPQHPVYEEWRTSGHATVVEEINFTNNLVRCGQCHSGSVRVSLLDGLELPDAAAAARVPQSCPTCHETHQDPPYPALVRNPLESTNDYFVVPSTNFAAGYDPNINLCAQCHNHRGATWTDSSRPPHRSPQYNVLLGTVGELDSGLPPDAPGTHSQIPRQCVACHMQTAAYVSPEQPAVTGHGFTVSQYDLCLNCHPLPELLVEFTTMSVSNQIQQVKWELDYWASNKAPQELWTTYGTRAWEYTVPGDLSPGGPGPTAEEQALIPENIRKARFNLYLVLYDGSFGVHNGRYTITLLETARTWVENEINN
jgi:hypothetical protein